MELLVPSRTLCQKSRTEGRLSLFQCSLVVAPGPVFPGKQGTLGDQGAAAGPHTPTCRPGGRFRFISRRMCSFILNLKN